jgi:3-oxoacyl-ACP reductase-like protein
MSIFGNIMSAIFHHPAAAQAAPAPPASPPASGAAPGQTAAPSTSGASPSAPSASASAAPAQSKVAPPSSIDVAAVLTSLAAKNKEKLDWRKSIVDLMKLLNLDSSLSARKQLAQELHYSGDMNDSASMNVWLHKQVMTKLAENGGRVPEELKHS